MSHFFFLLDKVVKLISGGSVINGACLVLVDSKFGRLSKSQYWFKSYSLFDWICQTVSRENSAHIVCGGQHSVVSHNSVLAIRNKDSLSAVFAKFQDCYQAVLDTLQKDRKTVVQTVLTGSTRKKYLKVLKVTYQWHIEILIYQYKYEKYRDGKLKILLRLEVLWYS